MEKKALKYYQDKLFIGGLSFKTTDQSLEKYFSKYGAIKQANVMKYTDRQVSRGFGFCIFENPQSAELAMETKTHVIDGRKVDVRWALPKEMAPPPQASDQIAKPAIRKIFVGGLSVDTHDNDLRDYFSQFGEIENASVMYHHDKRHSRGFGFVLFKSSASVNTLMQAGPHVIRNKTVDVKKAYPKDELANQAEPSETVQEPLYTRLPKQGYGFSSPLSSELNQSPTSHDSLKQHNDLKLDSLKQNDLKLEFFDEQDNVPLPTYQGTTNTVNSPLYNYGSGFLNQSPFDPYTTVETDWNTKNHYLYDPYSYRQHSPSQFNSISGEQDGFNFASTGGYSHRNSLSSFGVRSSLLNPPLDSSPMTPYQRNDMSFFDSVGSTGSRSGISRHAHFASQRNFLGSDSGLDDFNQESHFYSNGGKVGLTQDLMDGYPSSHGFENEYGGYMSHLSLHHFDNTEAEEIDTMLNESLGNRSFSKQRRSKNHLIFNGMNEPLNSLSLGDGCQTDV